MAKPRKGELCSNDQKLTFELAVQASPGGLGNRGPGRRVHFVVCRNPATTVRKSWRFGDRTKGEKVTVDVRYALCTECAQAWDDNEAERRGEARCS